MQFFCISICCCCYCLCPWFVNYLKLVAQIRDFMKKVTILWGLPGSGKTTYANLFSKKDTLIVNLDLNRKRNKKPKDIVESKSFCLKTKKRNHIIFDGLITTNEAARELISAINFACDFEIVFWSPDREACLHNDYGRRKESSEITIKNLPFEEPSKELIAEFNITLINKQVVKKSNYEIWCIENRISELSSYEWCLGGVSCNYAGYISEISPEEYPVSFTEFDDFIEKICPNITLPQYRNIYSNCVSVEVKQKNDYYGGFVFFAKYVVDAEKLYSKLKELNVI